MIVPKKSRVFKSTAHDPLTCGLGADFCAGCRAWNHEAEVRQLRVVARRATWLRRKARAMYWSGLAEDEAVTRLQRLDQRTTAAAEYSSLEAGLRVRSIVAEIFRDSRKKRPSPRALAERRRRKFEARVRKLLARELPEAMRLLLQSVNGGSHAK